MSDRVIILMMFTGIWILGAWGTFSIVKIRSSYLKNKQKNTRSEILESVAAGYKREYKLTLKDRQRRIAASRKDP